MENITSKNNTHIKDLIKIKDNNKFRNDKSLFFLEGEKLVFDTPYEFIKSIYIEEDKVEYFLKKYNYISDNNLYILPKFVFDKIKSTNNSQGIIALAKYDFINDLDNIILNNIKCAIFLENINDPGNLGTIIRLSEASKVDLIVLTNNCCSLYNPKVIRSSMSSIFRTKIYITDENINTINLFKSNNFKILATSLSDISVPYYNINYNDKNLIIFGNEANGVSETLLNASDSLIKIPMFGNIESLNVSISAAVICYEMAKQNYF